GPGQFNQPSGVAIDSKGNVYVSDTYNDRVEEFTSDGDYLTQWGAHGSGEGEFDLPIGIATDAAGNVYVADFGNSRIQKFGFLPTPVQTATWGSLKARYR